MKHVIICLHMKSTHGVFPCDGKVLYHGFGYCGYREFGNIPFLVRPLWNMSDLDMNNNYNYIVRLDATLASQERKEECFRKGMPT